MVRGCGRTDDNGGVDVSASLSTPVPPAELFTAVESLDTYPDWLDIVGRAEPVDAAPGDPGPAWSVDLRGQLGPLRRSKRLRMVRFVHNPPHRAQFSRRELDGKAHSRWTLTVDVFAADRLRDGDSERDGDGDRDGDGGSGMAGSVLEMALHYGGGLWVPLLDRILADEIERSKPRLLERLGDRG